MDRSLLDTDTLSEVMKRRNAALYEKSEEYVELYGYFTFSLITRFEILRGLKWKNAIAQLAQFDDLCKQSEIIPVTDRVITLAADFYAELKRVGQLIDDADLLIAATAVVHDLPLVTSNTAHFGRIPEVRLDCWTIR